jgi:Uma2 family endonuclease
MVATRPITVDEFEAMSLDGRWELIDGELVEMSPSADEPSAIGATITGMLWSFARPRRLGRVYNAEGGFVLFSDRETVRAPDVAFVRAERMPRGEARKHFARMAPDLAVEVLSPTDRISELLAKVQMYQESGVPLIWVVDPDLETITVIARDNPTVILNSSDDLDGGEILPGFSVTVAEIFAEE